MGQTWKPIDWEMCHECGSDVEVYTDADDGYVHDSDPVKCVDCGFCGDATVFEDGTAYINWRDSP